MFEHPNSMEVSSRQPVHVVYGGAQLFTAETPAKVGKLAHRTFLEFATTPDELNSCLDLDPQANIHARILQKLEHEPVEDYRIDFEDGYGSRPDHEEDQDAIRVAAELARAWKDKTLPRSIGIRIKAPGQETSERSLRTLELFVTHLLDETAGQIPRGFVITLPKVIDALQVERFVSVLAELEGRTRLEPGTLRFEVMVETPQLLINRQGVCELAKLQDVSKGRLVAAHFGAYDYTASCDVTAAHQSLTHPACDFARQMMKLALSGTNIWLSDGATNIMPIGPNRAKPGDTLGHSALDENRRVVHQAWKRSFSDIRNSLIQGFYQGWDLHPAQIPVRYAAVYAFFHESQRAAAARLRNFIDRAAQASLVGNVFDDAASGQGLLNYFLRGFDCGALTEQEVLVTGLTLEELRGKSFFKIAQARAKKK